MHLHDPLASVACLCMFWACTRWVCLCTVIFGCPDVFCFLCRPSRVVREALRVCPCVQRVCSVPGLFWLPHTRYCTPGRQVRCYWCVRRSSWVFCTTLRMCMRMLIVCAWPSSLSDWPRHDLALLAGEFRTSDAFSDLLDSLETLCTYICAICVLGQLPSWPVLSRHGLVLPLGESGGFGPVPMLFCGYF